MNEEQNKIYEEIYSLYPKGVNDLDEEEYRSTAENIELINRRKKVPELLIQYEKLISALKKEDFGLIINDWSESASFENSMKVVLSIAGDQTELPIKLVLNISVIMPYFSFHQGINNPDSVNIKKKGWFNTPSFQIPSEFERHVGKIRELLHIFYPEYKEIPISILELPVTDITYNFRGYLANEEQGFTDLMTVFNAVFSITYL